MVKGKGSMEVRRGRFQGFRVLKVLGFRGYGLKGDPGKGVHDARSSGRLIAAGPG